MAACSHGAGYASCPPEKVSTDFNQADKGTGILNGKRPKHAYNNSMLDLHDHLSKGMK
jgi:hypothetical protein